MEVSDYEINQPGRGWGLNSTVPILPCYTAGVFFFFSPDSIVALLVENV